MSKVVTSALARARSMGSVPRERLQLGVEARPGLSIDLALQALPDHQLARYPEPLGRQLGGTLPHAFRDVVAGNHEVAASLVLAAEHQVRVRVIGVPVIDGDPLEPRAQVTLHLAHQVAGEGEYLVKSNTNCGYESVINS